MKLQLLKEGTLSKDESLILKGLAILGIVLHNFCHNIPGSMAENEFLFSMHRTHAYFGSLAHGEHLFINFFSYWGHFGVAVFVFLTAYGLTMKSLRSPESMGMGWKGGVGFVWTRAKKLWAIMVSAIILYCMVNGLIYKATGGWGQFYVCKKSLMVFTLVANAIGPWVPTSHIFGPWWYWALAFELVLLYRIAVHGRKDWVIWAVTLVCLSVCVGLSVTAGTGSWISYVKNNFVGWMPPFLAGVLMARKGVRPTGWCCLLAVPLLVGTCFNNCAWHLSQLCALLVFLGLLKAVRWQWLSKALAWVGSISMFLFASHTMMRNLVQPYTTLDNFWQMLPLYLVLIFATTLLCKTLHNRIVAPYLFRIEKR